MKRILQDGNTYIVSAQRGEELVQGLKKFCNEHQIEAASFSAIGAAGEIDVAWYDLDKKQYVTTLIEEDVEIVSLTGNVSKLNNDLIVHSHGVFGDKEMQTRGGHVNKAVISGACEITLHCLEGTINRAYDDETGLNLMA